MSKNAPQSKFQVEFLPEVNDDVLEAYDWYEAQAAGLGNQFIIAIDAAIHQIEREPELFQKIYKVIRKCNAKRFPFGVFYTLNKKVITVIAVTHLARHPKTWKHRKK
jgi:toxin ParE1/3/4